MATEVPVLTEFVIHEENKVRIGKSYLFFHAFIFTFLVMQCLR